MSKIRGFVPPEPPPAQPALPPAQGNPQPAERPVRYLSTGQVAMRVALTPGALGNLLRRYRNHTEHPSPVEDAVTDADGKHVLGWLPERVAEVGAWLASLPGSGSAPRSGRWRDEAPDVSWDGLPWVSLQRSRGSADHVLTADRSETLCGIKVKGTGEPRGKRCRTCGPAATRDAA